MTQQENTANNGRVVQVLRVVVASPGDVQAERNVLPAVIEEVNHSVARDRGVRLELLRWETDAFPGFHPEGPQGLIDNIFCIEDCDILIGIFWKRFGTPTLDAQSGTEHEFRRAYAAWQQQGKPHIMMYFNQKPYMPQSREETDQWGQVLDFRRHFPKEGLWWAYKGKGQFERFVRRHLTQVLHAQQALVVEGPDSRSTASLPRQRQPTPGAEALAGLRQAYLTWLLDAVRAMPLSGVDPQGVREESRRDLDLAAVYTALMTQRQEAVHERELRPDREARRLSALAVLNAEPRLALLGEPGSGKSTFVNFVALCLAGELLGRTEANLQVLRAPLPDEEVPSRPRQEPGLQPWAHGPLMPLRVILREFVARGLPPVEAEVSSDTLWDFVVAELPATLRDFAPALRMELHDSGGLLLLDGLDEVPEAEQRRTQVKAAVEKFATVFPRVRLLVTSRTYAYQQQDWKLRDFAEAVLAPFGESQMRRFVERWYAYVGHVRGLSPDDVQGRARLLNEAITRNPRLYELATRPLLLTLMASLHAWRGGTLPEQRERLYAEAVELLLDQWESQKMRRRDDGTYAVVEPSLLEWLRVDHEAIRQMLNRLAFAAQQQQPMLLGTADIAQSTLVEALMSLQDNPDVRPGRLIEYLSDRAGLLEPRGVGVYTLPHRTFQEYLAACHLTDNDFPDALVTLFCAEPNRWREVVLLAGAKAVRGMAEAAWTLAEALCCTDPPLVQDDEVVGAWGALLAAQVLIENNRLGQIPLRHRPKVERIRTWLVRTLRHNAFPAVERVRAGDALAVLGDPRFRADAWYLPDEPLLGFVKIPAGTFRMGSDPGQAPKAFDNEQPQHKVVLPSYYIAHYLVTVAQFRAFVEDSGYDWEGKGLPQGALHHPIVHVNWHDAVAYCQWLTGCLQGWAETPQELAEILRQPGGRVILPSEAEWERAARGTETRVYPWGNAPDVNRANYVDTGIGTTSTVGCFSAGTSLDGVEDLSGNVWEWTRSIGGAYPYPRQKAARARREDLQAPDDPPRVLRGGAAWDSSQYVRCAFRLRDDARLRDDGVGFRVVVVSGLL